MALNVNTYMCEMINSRLALQLKTLESFTVVINDIRAVFNCFYD